MIEVVCGFVCFIVGLYVGYKVGCAAGIEAFIEAMKEHGWEVVDDDGDLRPRQMYGDHWYKSRNEEV